MKFLDFRWTGVLGASLGTVIVFASTGAIAAERVVLKYRIFRATVSVEELTTLAEAGETSPTLRSYLRLANRSPEELQDNLNQEVEVNPRLLDRVLNSPVGDLALDQVGDAIHTPSQQADRQALRAAITLSAQDDGRIKMIELLQNYPTEEVHVDGDRIVAAYNDLQAIRGRVTDILEEVIF